MHGHAHAAEQLEFGGQDFGRQQVRRQGGQPAARHVPGGEEGHGHAFFRQIPGHGQGADIIAQNRHPLALAGHAQGFPSGSTPGDAGAFQGTYGQSPAQGLPDAGCFTGVFAQSPQHAGHGQNPFQELAGAVVVAGSHFDYESAHIHMERAGGLTMGPFFLDAVALDGVQSRLLIHATPSRE